MGTLAIIGTVPPPFGGVSVHVSRKIELLKRHGIDVRLYEQKGKSDPEKGILPFGSSATRLIKLLLTYREELLHIHFNNHRALGAVGQLMKLRRRKKYLLTIHSEKLTRWWDEKRFPYQKLMGDCFSGAEHIICVNQNILEFLQNRLGIPPERLSMIPAYLAPSQSELREDNIPDEILKFISGRKVVGTHGWFGYFIKDAHVYSFDHIAKLAEEVVKSDRDICIYTVISGCYDEQHREQIKSIQEPLSDNWLIVETPFCCAALYEKTDLFLRPTVTDGDSVSIRECLSLGTKVLASDAVPRPHRCQLYPSRNYEQLSSRFWELIDSNEPLEHDETNFEAQLVSVIQNALTSSNQ